MSSTETTENTVATTTTSAQEQQQQQQQQDSPRSTKSSTIQHPLEYDWALWFHNPVKKTNATNFFQNLNQVYKVSTIEQFWGLYNHILTPSKLGIGCTYYLFKEGIEPKWEDKQCEGGGEWMISLEAKLFKTGVSTTMDQYWLNAMLACIAGGTFGEHEDYVCGVAVMIRKVSRISLWVATGASDEVILSIGESFRNAVLLLDGGATLTEEEQTQAAKVKVQYKTFADQLKYIRAPKFEIPQSK